MCKSDGDGRAGDEKEACVCERACQCTRACACMLYVTDPVIDP